MCYEARGYIMHQSIPAAPIPPPGNCRAFARLVTPGGGALANLAWPGGRAFTYPGATPGLLTARGFDSQSKHGGFCRERPAVCCRLARP